MLADDTDDIISRPGSNKNAIKLPAFDDISSCSAQAQ